MSTSSLAIGTVFFLLCAAIGGILIGPHNALKGRKCAKLPMKSLGDSPILQVELARSEEDLQKVIGAGDLDQNIKDARAGNLLDSFVFIPGYAGYLLTLGLLLARGESRYAKALFLLAVIAVPVAALCDELENYGIEKTLQHFSEPEHKAHPGDAMHISIPSIIKWVLITVVSIVYGIVAIRHPRHWGRFVIGAMLLLAGLCLAFMLIRYALERFA